MMRLGVNVDHVATLREARRTLYPDPVTAALLAEQAGAHGITVHLRQDRRHIKERDLKVLREVVQTKLNIEMAPIHEMIKIALDIKPDTVTLVPERAEELTTEGGLDVAMNRDEIARIVKELKEADIGVSIFIDPEIEQVRAAHKANADIVEINTGSFCDAIVREERQMLFDRIVESAKVSSKLNLVVAAGHGINYHNIIDIVKIGEIEELNIGHSIISKAVFVGMERAVKEMLELMGW